MKILYTFSSPRTVEEDLIKEKKIPTDRLYMAAELRKFGHQVDIDGDRYKGLFGVAARVLRKRLHTNAIGLKTFIKCRKYDVVVLKDEFCTLVTLACRLWGVKLVNLDSLGIDEFPKTLHRRLEHRANLLLANSVITYSISQIDTWSAQYSVLREKFVHIPYAIDMAFYERYLPLAESETDKDGYVLSVGCDAGRDFTTLVKAAQDLGVRLKLVSVPARVSDQIHDHSRVQYYNNLSYEELFDLYANARCVVIPIRSGVVYPCGVRGLLEAMAFGKAVVVSRTPILEEYVSDGKDALLVQPEDSAQLCEKMRMLYEDDDLHRKLGSNARKSVSENFDISTVSQKFAYCLKMLSRPQTLANP